MTGLKNKTAAFLVMAAVLISTGCAMKRDLIRVEEKVNQVRSEQNMTSRAIGRLDSLLSSESDETVKLRAEIRSTINSLLEEFSMMQAGMADMQDKMGYILSQGGQQPMAIIPKKDSTGHADTTSATSTMPGVNCQELYDESFINISRGEYDAAIKGFTDYLQYCGKQDLADNARFWIGEAYYSMEKYQEAIREFKQMEIDYSGSEKRPGAMYKMARSYEELGNKADAKAIFQKLVDDYPGTLESEQAKEKLKEMK